MGDLREMLQRLRQDLQEPNILVTTLEEHVQTQLAIIDAIREEQHEEYWFNVGNATFATVEGQETYARDGVALPLDFALREPRFFYNGTPVEKTGDIA